MKRQPKDDQAILANLDTEYQAAVKINDVAALDRILADDFVLVTGRGRIFTKADLLNSANNQEVIYEHQEDTEQTVRIWGDTAVVTALLWQKGTNKGETFDDKLWFSDTYVRTPAGWRYVFGQASIRLPDRP
jgi:ketosteroid isomerase-like protein